MSCITKYLKNPIVSLLTGIALGAGSTYYYNYYKNQASTPPLTNEDLKTSTKSNTKNCSGKVIQV